jgi:L-fuculose-phosphate aldolase
MDTQLRRLRAEIVEIGRRVYDRGYVASNDGNISVRLDDRSILITPTGVSKGFMKPGDLIVVDLRGRVLEGTKRPSSETHMHLQIYRDRPDVNAVCHAHPPYATGFAVAGIPLDRKILPEFVIALGSVPVVEYGATGTAELYGTLRRYVPHYDAFLLANHGAVTVGDSVLGAYHRMETLEHAAMIQFVAHQLGRVNELSAAQVAQLVAMRKRWGIRPEVGLKPVSRRRPSTR